MTPTSFLPKTLVVVSRAAFHQSGLDQLLRKGEEKQICWGKALTGSEGLESSLKDTLTVPTPLWRDRSATPNMHTNTLAILIS